MTTVQRVNNKNDNSNNSDDNRSDLEERFTSQAALGNFPISPSDNNYSFESGIPSDLPKLNTIRQTIPAECFQSNVLKSMYYVVKDTFLIVFLYIGLCYLERFNMNRIAYGFIYPIYWYLQGTMMIAYFVLGHDCGHGSFSQYQLLNDIVGNILHTVVLAPYYPWKITHRKHHNHTANIDKDEVFYPKRKSDLQKCECNTQNVPNLPGFGLGIGWIVYLFKGYCPRHVCHFNPFDKFFHGHLFGTVASVTLYILWCVRLLFYVYSYGFLAFLVHYFIPVLVFGAYLVIITFLQHNELEIAWYPNSEWNYVKGQLSTVDRHYGHVHNIIHNISTHQIHHLFTSIPHYHLEKATKAFREHFPGLVNFREERIMVAFYRMFKIYTKQNVVDDVKVNNFKAYYYKK